MQKIKRLLITWDGIWSIPFAALLLLLVSGLLLQLNPNADVIGIGQLQDVFTATFRLIVANTVAQIGVGINVFMFFGLRIKEFKLLWEIQKTSVKVLVVLGLYACYLIAFVAALP